MFVVEAEGSLYNPHGFIAASSSTGISVLIYFANHVPIRLR